MIFPANSARNAPFPAPLRGRVPASRVLRACQPGEHGRMQTLVTGVSGYVGAALVPRLSRDGHAVRGFARSAAACEAAGGALDDLVLGDATTGAGLDAALDGVDVAYYLIHSMEGPAARLRRASSAARPRRSPPRRPAPACARIVYLGGLLPHDGDALAPPRLAPRGRGDAAGRRAGVGRAARLDRDRRPLALLPLPRAADRAPARARAAGLARQPHAADRRARRARVPGRRRDAARDATPAGRGTSAARTR